LLLMRKISGIVIVMEYETELADRRGRRVVGEAWVFLCAG
jgi:hypothetical protein